MRTLSLLMIANVIIALVSAQTGPWQNALLMRTSADGTNFSTPVVLQDSSGVPSVIQLQNGDLLCAFQWFPSPVNGPAWDSVAVKRSSDNGTTWTCPQQVNFINLPANFKRPFDPTLVQLATGEIRMYFSSGVNSGMGLDGSVDTYSALSTDGINFTFEANARFDLSTLPVIDPAATYFNSEWHYTAPVGAPADGAYHATSADGLTFTQGATITSDAAHQWTGNLLADGTELKFYGSGPSGIWWNSSTDGNTWNGYTSCSITGGDPSVVKLAGGTYVMIYVSTPNYTTVNDFGLTNVKCFPNPAMEILRIQSVEPVHAIDILDVKGCIVEKLTSNQHITEVNVSQLAEGLYIFRFFINEIFTTKLVSVTR